MTFGELFEQVGWAFGPKDETAGLLMVVVEDGFNKFFLSALDWKDDRITRYSATQLYAVVIAALGNGMAQVGDPADETLRAAATVVAEEFRQVLNRAKRTFLEQQPIAFAQPKKAKRDVRRSA